MPDNRYNDWTNRETWATALHIEADPDLQNHRNELRKAARVPVKFPASIGGTRATRSPIFILADSLREWVEGMHEDFFSEPIGNAGLRNMFSDVGSIWRINYDEIARNLLEDFTE